MALIDADTGSNAGNGGDRLQRSAWLILVSERIACPTNGPAFLAVESVLCVG